MSVIAVRKNLPKELTSYDLIKSLAVILMICDHVGFIFFPEEMWFRTLGRLCLPIWFFLIGYARESEIPKSFWIGGGIVAASSLIAGQFLLPMNILFTIIFLRLYRDKVARYSLASPQALRGMFFILFLSSFPSSVLFEYGSLAVYERVERKYILMYVVVAFFTTYIMQGIAMPYLTGAQAWVLTLGYAFMGGILWHFKPVAFTDARRYMAGSFIKIFQFLGRWTLEIYVVHIVALRIAAMILFPERFSFLGWQIVDPNVFSIFIVH